ncbi:hypothetical protein C8T65DRAFT_762959 [Cerioporus squamosus]|nr:hypothetical protein C8T65DRAFT_762959 [Cerioporus squamosus]
MWEGGMGPYGQFCLDFYDVERKASVNLPRGYSLHPATVPSVATGPGYPPPGFPMALNPPTFAPMARGDLQLVVPKTGSGLLRAGAFSSPGPSWHGHTSSSASPASPLRELALQHEDPLYVRVTRLSLRRALLRRVSTVELVGVCTEEQSERANVRALPGAEGADCVTFSRALKSGAGLFCFLVLVQVLLDSRVQLERHFVYERGYVVFVVDADQRSGEGERTLPRMSGRTSR